MVTAKLLNPGATINSFRVNASQDFVPGEDLTLNLRLFDVNENERRIPASTAIITVIFNNVDGSTLTKTGTINANDRSFFTIALSSVETSEIFGGNAVIVLDDLGNGSKLERGIIPNLLRSNTISN